MKIIGSKEYYFISVFVFIVQHVQCLPNTGFTLKLTSGQIGTRPEDAVGLSFLVELNEEAQPLLRPNRLLSKRQQVLEDIPVWGFGGTWEQGQNIAIVGTFAENVNEVTSGFTDINNQVSQSAAFSTAFTAITGSKDARRASRKGIKTFPSNGNDPRFKKFVFLDPDDDFKVKLVYYFDFYLQRKTSSTNAFVFVDAHTNKVVQAYEQLITAENINMLGDGGNTIDGFFRYGEGRWAGRKLNVTKDNNQCFPKNEGVEVARVNKDQLFFPPQQCFNTEDFPAFKEKCNPGSPNIDKNEDTFSQVHDALFYANQFQDVLRDMYGDITLHECCGPLKLCVQWPDPEMSFFFSHAPGEGCPTYYGRSGDLMVDMATPSFVGHELGHAFTFCTSVLQILCQSGAIAEAFSDLSGIILKASLNNYNTDWRFGSEVRRNTGGIQTALRYLNNPPLDGKSIDHFNDYTCQDVHFSAGIFNKAIFNLASTQEWDLVRVYQIFIRANKYYWRRQTGFNEGLCGLLNAAKDYGYRKLDVEKAFAKVGVVCDCDEGWVMQEREIKYTDSRGTLRTDFNTRKSCFKIANEKSTWAEASTYCKSINGRLVVIMDKEKSDFLNQQLDNKKIKYWVGSTDLNIEKEWKWVAVDKPLSITRWHDNQPDNAKKSQNCMALSFNNGVWGWSDEACSFKNSFICEKA